MNVEVLADHRVTLKECKNKGKYLVLARDVKKTVVHESSGNTNCNWWLYQDHKRIGKMTRGSVNKKTSGENLNYSIIEIDQNTEKSPGDLRSQAVTQILVRNHRLTLVGKTQKE